MIADADDPVELGARIATTLAWGDHFELATEYAERALRADPTRPSARTALALSALGLGQSERALAEFERAATDGDATHPERLRGIRVALERDDLETARALSRHLLGAQLGDAAGQNNSIAASVLDAWRRGGHPGEALDLVAELAPALLEPAIAGATLTAIIASLYEEAGALEVAESIHLEVLDDARVTADRSERSTRMNNLAYSIDAVHERDVARGVDLVRRAIGDGTLQRHGAYLDTLGWLVWRRGDRAEAERLVRAALVDQDYSRGRVDHELLEHYAALRRAAGDPITAGWLLMRARIYQSFL